MKKTILIVAIIAISFVNGFGQWRSAQKVGVSSETHWDGFCLDSSGNMFCAGISEKFPAPDTRKIVITKFDKDLNKIWDVRLVGGATIYHTSIGVDAAGNSYTIGKFAGSVTRTDGSKFSSPFNSHFVIKVDASGKEVWSKRLVVSEYTTFKVLADGTICMLINGVKTFDWGDSVVNVSAQADVFLEISTDGGVRRAVSTADFPDLRALIAVDWKSPGKLFILDGPIISYYPPLYATGELDLDAKTITDRDTATISGSVSNSFTVSKVVFEPSTGHTFAFVSLYTGNVVVNGTDTLTPWTNNDIHDAHLLEFDKKMKLVHRLKVTNPFGLVVRDTQIAILANIHYTWGFTSPTGVFTTKKGFDGAIVYVVNRNFEHSRHGVIEAKNSAIYTNLTTTIDARGDIATSLMAGSDLFYLRATDTLYFASPLSSTASGTVISKLANAGQSSVRRNQVAQAFTVFPNPLTANGNISYSLEKASLVSIGIYNVLGQKVMSLFDQQENPGTYDKHFDVSNLPNGSYVLQLVVDGIPSATGLNILR